MKPLFTILFLLLSFITKAQETFFRGFIYADSIATTQINIVNLQQKKGTVNGKKGEFKIEATTGDEILFSSVQYEILKVTVTKEMLSKKANIIYLYPIITQLSEVNISNLDLSGNLENDVKNLKVNPYFNPASVGLPVNLKPKPSVEERRLYTAQSGGPVGILIDVLSGRMAMLKRMLAIAEYEAVIQKAKNALPASFFIDTCKIPAAYIDDFIYFSSKDENFETMVNKNDKLVLVEFFQQKIESYKEFKEWED